MPTPEISSETTFWATLGGLGVFFGSLAGAFFRIFWGKHDPDATEQPPQSFVFQGAELADLKGLGPALASIGPKLEQVLRIDEGNRELLQTNNLLMQKMVEILQRIEQDGILRNRKDEREETIRLAREEAIKIARDSQEKNRMLRGPE